jgi:hypothetical protein
MFHVEHAPIQPPPPSVPTLLDQLMNAGIDDLNRESLSELGERLGGRPANAR